MSANSLKTLVTLLISISIGCQPAPVAESQEETLPKLSELESSVPDRTQREVQPGQGASPHLVVRKLLFPADDGRVDLALQMLDEPEFDTALLSRWRANGLRIARLGVDQWTIMSANMPKPINSQTTLVLLSNFYTPLNLFPGTGTRSVVQRDETGNQKVHELGRGEFQLLMQLNTDDDDDDSNAPLLRILPHYYQSRATVLPRTQEEKMLDGVSFTDLKVSAAPPADVAWLIWSDAPAAAIAKNPDEAPEPTLLGRAMFSGEIGSKPVRLLLLVTGTAAASPRDRRTMEP